MLSDLTRDRLLDAKTAIECNATDGRTIDDTLAEWANSHCMMDATGDVWDHDHQYWWDDETAEEFLRHVNSL